MEELVDVVWVKCAGEVAADMWANVRELLMLGFLWITVFEK